MFSQCKPLIRLSVSLLLVVGLLSTTGMAVEDFTVSNFGDGSQIWFEAEAFDLALPEDGDNFIATAAPDGEDAFGDDDEANVINRNGDDGRITYTFSIDQLGEPGEWHFWGRVINPGNRSDFMLVEGHPGDVVPTEEPFDFSGSNALRVFERNTGPPFGWSGGSEGHVKQLQAGENTMHILDREGDNSVFWDVMMWTDDPDYVPTDEDYLDSEPFVAIDLPGDFNSDGQITAADYEVILENFNAEVIRGSDGDITFNGKVDYRDLVQFRKSFEQQQVGAAASVPEPASKSLMLVSALFLAGMVRKRRRSVTPTLSFFTTTFAMLGCLLSSNAMAQDFVIQQQPGTEYLAFEAEDYFALSNADDESGWNVVNTDDPFQSPAPVAPASKILDASSTNAVRGSAIFDFPGGNDQDFVQYRLNFVEDGDYSLYVRYSLFNLRNDAGYGNEDSIYISSDFGVDEELIDTFADPRGPRDDLPSFYQTLNGDFAEGNYGWRNAAADGSDPTAENPDAIYTPDLNTELDFGIAAREAGVSFDRIIFHMDPNLSAEDLDAIVSFDPFTFGSDPNDVNSDGSVDLTDIDVMRENFGLSFALEDSLERGDANRDGVVNLYDFLAVRTIINPAADAPAAASNVPEPSGRVALLFAIAGLVLARRKRGL